MSLSDEERRARERIQFLFGRPVAFHRCFVNVTGSVHAALVLSQALYWLNPDRQGVDRGKDEGWFWKTRGEWEAEIGLSRWEQETARKQLRATTFWREKERRLEHRIYFSVDFLALEKALSAAANASTRNPTSLRAEGGNSTPGGGGIPTSGKAESHPPPEAENQHRRKQSHHPRQEHILLQRLPETVTSSELAAGLYRLMPDTAWDKGAVCILWNLCRSEEPGCTVEMILQQVAEKLRMKGWRRIQNPVGFLLTSVPQAIHAATTVAKLREQTRAEHDLALAKSEAQQELQCQRDLAAWKMAERAFEALSAERKQELVNHERHRFLREYPEYRDRVYLPGWEQSFRNRAMKACLAQDAPSAPGPTEHATQPSPHANEN